MLTETTEQRCVCVCALLDGGQISCYMKVPPWQQKIFSSTIAATGKQLKQSVKVFHSFMLYRLLPVRGGKPITWLQSNLGTPEKKKKRKVTSCSYCTRLETALA